ncbi:MAG: hypothetical protein DI617_07145 [Streptococcus pyogenes]|nr:MAG: hypothetical protein DI617_07145 [Streptococcus pyogenes]
MSKKFLQSLTILGLLSTALGVAQPVGAVVSGNKLSKKILIERLKELGNEKKLNELGNYHWLEYAYIRISDKLNVIIEILSDPIYHEDIYSGEWNKLSQTVLTIIDVLTELKSKTKNEGDANPSYKLYNQEIDAINKKIKETTDLQNKKKLQKFKLKHEYLNSGVDQLTPKQIEYLVNKIDKAKQEFEDKIYSIQQKVNIKFYPYGLHYDNVQYFDSNSDQNLEKYKSIMRRLFVRENQVYALYYAYKDSSEVHIKDSAEQLFSELNVILSKRTSFSEEAYYKTLVSQADVINALGGINDAITNFSKELEIDREKILRTPQFDTYKFNSTMNQDEQKEYLSKNSEIIKKYIGELKLKKQVIMEKSSPVSINNSKIVSEEAKGLWLDYDYSHEFDHLNKEEFKKLDEEKQKELEKYRKDEIKSIVIEEPQALSSEPQEEVTVQSSLDDYTKSQINFWIEDFNTSLNKINYSGIYSEYLESLITRGKQLRNKLDKALGENKSSDDIKRDLDQLEMISNTITSVGNARNS